MLGIHYRLVRNGSVVKLSIPKVLANSIGIHTGKRAALFFNEKEKNKKTLIIKKNRDTLEGYKLYNEHIHFAIYVPYVRVCSILTLDNTYATFLNVRMGTTQLHIQER